MPDYVTQADVITAVPKLATNPDLANLITDVCDAVSTYTGRTFGLLSLIEAYDGSNQPRLWLRQTPVLSITSVTVNGEPIDNTNGDGWTVNPSTGELRRGNGQTDGRFAPWFPKGTQNIVVNYTAGSLNLPPSVRRAIILWIKMVADSMKVTGQFQSEKLGDYSYTIGDPSSLMMPPLVRFFLGPWVQDWIA